MVLHDLMLVARTKKYVYQQLLKLLERTGRLFHSFRPAACSQKCNKWLTDYFVPGNAVPIVKITLGTPFPGVPTGNNPWVDRRIEGQIGDSKALVNQYIVEIIIIIVIIICLWAVIWLSSSMCSEGYQEAAAHFENEANIEPTENMCNLHERMQVREAIQNGEIENAVQLMDSHFPGLLLSNDELRFQLQACNLLSSPRYLLSVQNIEMLNCHLCIPTTTIFTVRRSLHGICYSNSVRPSVCPSVCHTRGLCPHGSTYDHDFFTTG